MLKTFLLLSAVLLATPAAAVEITSSDLDVDFDITHPAKEYSCNLLDGGGVVKLDLDPADFSKSTVQATVQVGNFDSANTRRDSHMLEVLEGLIFPTITWTVNSIGLTGPLTPGTHETSASGPLTIKEKTSDLKAPLTLTVSEDGAITVTSAFSVSLEAYGVKRPSLMFVQIEDEVPIRVTATFPANADVFAKPEPEPEPEPEPVDEAPVDPDAAPPEEAKTPE